MIRIGLTTPEREDGVLRDDHLAAAVDAIAADGVVVLESAVPLEPLDVLKARMDEDTERLIRFQEAGGGNPRARGHLQQGPPPLAGFVFPGITANPFAIQVSKAILGKQAYLAFHNGNTNCPDSVHQAVHVDNGHLWPNHPMASPPYSLVVNISPMDCSSANGAVELWPGTHMLAHPYPGNHVPEDMIEERRQIRGPVQAETRKGDLVIRDTRLWHRGVPNCSDAPRHMIAFIHAAGWLVRNRKIPFELACRPALARVEFDFNADYTEGEIDYLFEPTRQLWRRDGSWRDDRAAAPGNTDS